MSRYLIRRIEQNPAIVLRTNSEIVSFEGNSRLEQVRWQNDQTGKIESWDIRHVFLMTRSSRYGMAQWLRRARRQRVHQDRTRSVAGRPGRRALAASQGSLPPGNKPARSVRGWRCSERQYQARGIGGGRRIDRDLLRSSGAARVEEKPMAEATCAHIEAITIVRHAKLHQCDECVKFGSRWVHLRTCQECGVTRCCDDSPGQHAPSMRGRAIIR